MNKLLSIIFFALWLCIIPTSCASNNEYQNIILNASTKLTASQINTDTPITQIDSFNEFELQNFINERMRYLPEDKITLRLVVMDLEGNLITSIGDIDDLYSPESIFRAFSVAILLDKHNLDLEADVDNSDYIFDNGKVIPSWYDFNPNYTQLKNAKSFRDNFIHVNFSSLIREYDKLESNSAILTNIEKLNFSINNDYINSENFSLFTTGKGVEISLLNMAKAFSIFVNNGNLIDMNNENIISKETSDVMKTLLFDATNFIIGTEQNNNKVAGLFDTSSYIEPSSKETYLKTSFAGFAPFDKPEYIIVADAKIMGTGVENAIEPDYLYDLISSTFGFIKGNEYDDRYLPKIENIAELDNLNNDFIYFGRPSCPDCTLFLPELIKIANERQIKVHFFDTDRWRGNSNFESIMKEYGITEVPYLIRTHDGTFDVIYPASNNSDWKNKLE